MFGFTRCINTVGGECGHLHSTSQPRTQLVIQCQCYLYLPTYRTTSNKHHTSQSDNDDIIPLKLKKSTTAPVRKTPLPLLLQTSTSTLPSLQLMLKKRNASSCVHTACMSHHPMPAPHPPAHVPHPPAHVPHPPTYLQPQGPWVRGRHVAETFCDNDRKRSHWHQGTHQQPPQISSPNSRQPKNACKEES
jgi:hypothetical protein